MDHCISYSRKPLFIIAAHPCRTTCTVGMRSKRPWRCASCPTCGPTCWQACSKLVGGRARRGWATRPTSLHKPHQPDHSTAQDAQGAHHISVTTVSTVATGPQGAAPTTPNTKAHQAHAMYHIASLGLNLAPLKASGCTTGCGRIRTHEGEQRTLNARGRPRGL